MESREEHTGIYVRTVTKAATPQDMATLLGQFAEKQNNRPLSTWVDETQARAESIRELEDVPDPVRRDACDALGHCLSIRHCLDAGEIAEAVYEAGLLGRVLERLDVREWEKYAAAGLKATQSQQHAREQKQRGVDTRDRQIVATVDKVKQDSPELKVESRNREAVVRLKLLGINVSESTVARALRRQKNLLSH